MRVPEGDEYIGSGGGCVKPRCWWWVGLRMGPVEKEIPSASLRAGSYQGLKSGSAQDEKVV